jgi:hypothetical protein
MSLVLTPLPDFVPLNLDGGTDEVYTEVTRGSPSAPQLSAWGPSIWEACCLVQYMMLLMTWMHASVVCNSLDSRRPANLQTALVTWYASASE